MGQPTADVENSVKEKFLFPWWESKQNTSIYFTVEQPFVFQLIIMQQQSTQLAYMYFISATRIDLPVGHHKAL
jgi:hypothetical protein